MAHDKSFQSLDLPNTSSKTEDFYFSKTTSKKAKLWVHETHINIMKKPQSESFLHLIIVWSLLFRQQVVEFLLVTNIESVKLCKQLIDTFWKRSH